MKRIVEWFQRHFNRGFYSRYEYVRYGHRWARTTRPITDQEWEEISRRMDAAIAAIMKVFEDVK